ncbi:MAG: 2-succinyl-5-enolpyruvyl-6-hydroxy-3-cyclohexene-1-carboxylic-acid synthase [Candidatus Marinimicrobia bacterium]|nr:2-succinyl-5-enolpyruvyl-6-hydroxy-3-cyclohexene-1-carboxylic-acid synthase [Candidatus Neomarinimicrobiota bacterium]
MNQNLVTSEWIIEEFIRLGATQFVISPGSRSTPLTAAAARNPKANTTVHIDERGAAYFALGHAKATGKPAVLICTSGTAVANYFPAVVEASMDNVPMIVLTADRPPELIDVGANQAIFQNNIYGVYPRLSLNLPAPDETLSSGHILNMVDRLYDVATGTRPGPVHLNCQFREPFMENGDEDNHQSSNERWRKSNVRFTQKDPDNLIIPVEQLEMIRKKIESSHRGLIVVGRSMDPRYNDAILDFSKTLNWPILPDVQSTLRFRIDTQIINHFDLILLKNNITESPPDMVIHLLGAYTSKRLLNYLNHLKIFYVVIKETPERIDPNHQVDLMIQGNIKTIIDSIHCSQPAAQTDWINHWQSSEVAIRQRIDLQLESESSISEPGVSYFLSRWMTQNQSLMLANSMPIREMEMFGMAGKIRGPVFANRGASGIDGLLATAAGYQSGSASPLTLLIGDLAFLHDLNSLGLIKQSAHPIIVVLINNEGGGIFNFLPITAEIDIFEPFFGTPHDLSFEKAAELFSLNYFQPNTMSELNQNYLQAQNNSESTIIEIRTDRSENYALHQKLFDIIRDS